MLLFIFPFCVKTNTNYIFIVWEVIKNGRKICYARSTHNTFYRIYYKVYSLYGTYTVYCVSWNKRVEHDKREKNISWGLLLEQTAEKYPDYIAIKSHEGTLTYKELNERANQFAHFLKSKNIVRGDTVTLCIDTRPELLVLYCGCTKIGHDPIAYIYTSGTTGGLPKAAVIT